MSRTAACAHDAPSAGRADAGHSAERLDLEVGGTLTRKSQIADPRNPVVGPRLIREWNGVEHTITVLRDGFEWQGRPYKSLSAIARAIAGSRWNGWVFFGLKNMKART